MISLLKRTELEFLLIDYGLEELVKIKQNLIFGKRKLLYAAKDTKNNQAIILKDFIENIKSGA